MRRQKQALQQGNSDMVEDCVNRTSKTEMQRR